MSAPPPATLAIGAAVLYLANLLVLPGIAFAVLLALWLRHRQHADAVARAHLDGALRGSVLAGVMLILVTLGILALGGFGNPGTWVFLIIYFVTIHAALVLVGVLALARALNGQPFHWPWPGRRAARQSRGGRNAD